MKPIIHSLVAKDGKYIVMPVWIAGEPSNSWGNLAHPNPQLAGGDAQQGYPIGTKFVDGDRTFFYGYVHSVESAKGNIGVFNISESATGTTANITWGSVSSVTGDTVVGLTTTGFANTNPDEDAFAGGWLISGASPYTSYRVLHSTTNTGARVNGEVDLTLDFGMTAGVNSGTGYGWLNFSEWKKLYEGWLAGRGQFAPVVGVSLILPTASRWQWLQSWGPCSLIPMNEEMGASNSAQQGVFHDDGTITVTSNHVDAQLAGWILNSAGTSFTQTWLIRLQINT